MMQHKYPFTVLLIRVDGQLVDVNVHPNKMELRFSDGEQIYHNLMNLIHNTLRDQELIADVTPGAGKKIERDVVYDRKTIPEPFEKNRMLQQCREQGGQNSKNKKAGGSQPESPAGQMVREPLRYGENKCPGLSAPQEAAAEDRTKAAENSEQKTNETPRDLQMQRDQSNRQHADNQRQPVQQTLADYADPDTRLLSMEARPKHRIIGQLFDTYWLVEYQDRFYMIDQHAAHEKILFEQMMHNYRNKEFTSQMISPPILLSLTMQEEILLQRYMAEFEKLGFVIDSFGGREYTVSAVPANLYGLNGQKLLSELIDGLSSVSEKDAPEMVLEKIASMSCKAAVKGNHRLSRAEAGQLIDNLLRLDNPYFCPHGRPVIISMTKYEIEKNLSALYKALKENKWKRSAI